MRLAAEHFWPWYSKPPRTIAVASAAVSADACAMMKSLPPVSPTMRGYDLYFEMLLPTVFHIDWNTVVLPVKWMPPRSACESAISETMIGSPGTKLITPGGSPASMSSFIVYHDERMAAFDGFQSEVPPISAGAVGRFPPIAVKLNGVTAYTKPSSPRRSVWFHMPCDDIGCSL